MSYLLHVFLLLFVTPLFAQEVITVSQMKKVMTGQDLSNSISWDTIPRQHLLAVSPLGRVEGEVTIVDGLMLTSTVTNKGKVKMARQWGVKSPFAVYAYVPEWEAFELEVALENEMDLQKLIEKWALQNGYDVENPIPFKVEGDFDKIGYHIISKPKKEKVHNHDLHKKAKKMFYLTDVKGQLVGFYSKYHEGVFTHKGQFTHTHFVDHEQKNMGHLDEISVTGKLILYLPKQS